MTNINQSKIKKATKVFNSVFNKYDMMNDLMSLGIHRLWKQRLIEWMNPKKDDHLIDMATGTGDIASAFLKRLKNQGSVTCVDPNKLMIDQGKKKYVSYYSCKIFWQQKIARLGLDEISTFVEGKVVKIFFGFTMLTQKNVQFILARLLIVCWCASGVIEQNRVESGRAILVTRGIKIASTHH